MNKIDFKNIKNKFNASVNLLDSSVYNTGIFSFVINLNNLKFEEIISNSNFSLGSIFFSDSNSTFLGFKKEKIFNFSNRKELNHIQKNISKFLLNTFFLNKEIYLQKTFIFGGHAFNVDAINEGPWLGLPIGNFVLPRYIFHDSKLIINFFSDSSVDKNNIQNIMFKYIHDLEELLVQKEPQVGNNLKKIVDYTDKKLYLNDLNKIIEDLNMRNSNLDKIVLSRIKKASFKNKISISDIMIKLLNNNKESMNFLYTINTDSHLVGSTPELILAINDNQLLSESLAGSNYNDTNEEFISNRKEIIEQKIVTDYIVEIFNKNAINIKCSNKPFIKRTSNIDHLCTSVSGTINNDKNIFDLLEILHPTPAIAGYPIKNAIDKINTINENRGWYGGPIGWVDNCLNGKFFLNIRSGLILDNDIYIFSGSGVIKESNSESEWEETEQKFNLMIASF